MQPTSNTDEGLAEFVHELTGCQDRLYYFIRSLCADPDAVEDIRQVVNMILWRKRHAFRPGSNFKAWAFQIARLEVMTHARKASRSKCRDFDPDLLELFAVEVPERIDELQERRKALAVCLGTLRPRDRDLLRHRYWSGGTLESFAKSAGCSVGTLKARLFQLRAQLRRGIQERIGEGCC